MSSVEALARQAVTLDSADADSRSCLAWAFHVGGDQEGAIAEAKRALALSPNLASAHRYLGAALLFSGRPREGLASLEAGIRLDPRDGRVLAYHLVRVVIAFYFSREYEAAVEVAKQAIRSFPDFAHPYRLLAAALGQLGRIAESKAALEQAIAIVPGAFETNVRERVPWMRPEDHAHLLEGLRKAGWQG